MFITKKPVILQWWNVCHMWKHQLSSMLITNKLWQFSWQLMQLTGYCMITCKSATFILNYPTLTVVIISPRVMSLYNQVFVVQHCKAIHNVGAKLFIYCLWKVFPYSLPVPGPVCEVTHHLKIACNGNITCSEFLIILVQFSNSGTLHVPTD